MYIPCILREFVEVHSKLLLSSHWVELNHDATLSGKGICKIEVL